MQLSCPIEPSMGGSPRNRTFDVPISVSSEHSIGRRRAIPYVSPFTGHFPAAQRKPYGLARMQVAVWFFLVPLWHPVGPPYSFSSGVSPDDFDSMTEVDKDLVSSGTYGCSTLPILGAKTEILVCHFRK